MHSPLEHSEARRVSLGMNVFLLLLALSAAEGQQLRRLDGSSISVDSATRIARDSFNTNHVTGAQIAIVNQGKLVFSYAHGLRQRNPDLPFTTQTTTWAASITKGLFGTYVEYLVEHKKFPLDTPVAQMLSKPFDQYPGFEKKAAAIVKDPRWQTVTPRMLLNHTGGFHNLAMFEPDEAYHIHFTPGSRFSYSGDGLNILQFAIEQRESAPLDKLMQDALFGPLGLNRTSMTFRPDFEANIADRFDDKEAFVAKTRRNPARAAGSATTSAEDLAKFAIALMDGKVVNQKALFHPGIEITTPTQFPLSLDKAPPEKPTYPNLAYGLGWGLLTNTKYGPAFFKEGHGDGAQNFMICFTKSKSCLILLTNSDNGERAFKTLSEQLLGNTVTPYAWHGYE